MIDHGRFVMSKYVSMEELLRDKCKALEEENKRLLQRLHTCKRRNREDKQRLKNAMDYYFGEAHRYLLEINGNA